MSADNDRGADFQPPAVTRASAEADARMKAVAESSQKDIDDAAAKENAIHDQKMGRTAPAPKGKV